MKRSRTAAFTIIELLVVVAIIALLIGILLPAIGKARDQARLTMSLTNLRNLATAHATYASEWSDRQFTLIDDNFASMGANAGTAMAEYFQRHGSLPGGTDSPSNHPPILLGWGYTRNADGSLDGGYRVFRYYQGPGLPDGGANHSLIQPIVFNGFGEYFGSFRLINAYQFSQYVSGRFYDKVFYAPKDSLPIDAINAGGCFDDPGEFCYTPPLPGFGDAPKWSSYILSPSAMFNHMVLANPNVGGYSNPFSINAGFRSPAMGQALYPSLKTHMLEHHWLQARRAECNPGYTGGTYDGCEPFYFNLAWESNPASLFYDGHVETVGVRKAERADGRQQAQTGVGLWSRDTPWGNDGYNSDVAYDYAQTSFHILTTNGIRGRDFTAD